LTPDSAITSSPKARSSRNRTLTCTHEERLEFGAGLATLSDRSTVEQILDRVIHQDFFTVAEYLPEAFVDLLVLDPPYNLSKVFNGTKFSVKDSAGYGTWFRSMLDLTVPSLKRDASIYVCADWRTSTIVAPILEEYFHIRNRITWEREKGRGAKTNWKNNTEDIWFCTHSSKYVFNVDDVKLKRKVVAPYKDGAGKPKDWYQSDRDKFRMTHPSNIWTDLTVPFWSMRENTDHPTQKPEKLLAKLILASSNPGSIVLDPFLGSGTTAIVCRKLGRHFVGIEQEFEYCCWAQKRLQLASDNPEIQGYADGVFWERNSGPPRTTTLRSSDAIGKLFDNE